MNRCQRLEEAVLRLPVRGVRREVPVPLLKVEPSSDNSDEDWSADGAEGG